MSLNYDFDDIVLFIIDKYNELKKDKITIGLQLPNENIANSEAIKDKILSTLSSSNKNIADNCKVLIIFNSIIQLVIIGESFSSCCVEEIACQHVGCCAIIHFGHACLSPTNFPVYYAFDRAPLDIESVKNEILKTFEEVHKKLIVFYDTCYNWAYDELKKIENENIEVTKIVKV